MKPLEVEIEQRRKLYATIMFALDEASPMMSKEEMNRRLCSLYLPKLKEYIELLKEDTADHKNMGFFAKVANKESEYDVKLRKFKESHGEKLTKLELCSNCKCLKCTLTCNMVGCHNCSPEASVVSCDNKESTVYFFENKFITLCDDDSGCDAQFKVLAHIYDKVANLFYIAMEVNGDKRLNYLRHSPQGDTYGVIEDSEDYDFAVKVYQEAFAEL